MTNLGIMIVDDHQMVIDGIKSMLVNESYIQLVAEANDGEAAMQILAQQSEHINFVISDISMPVCNGTELCKRIKQQYPSISVLFLSMYDNAAVVREAVSVEADGYILKNSGKSELLKAISKIADGGTYFSDSIIPLLYSQYKQEKEQATYLANLTEREREVLGLILKEYTSHEIGEQLFISKKTVDHHRTHLLEKTGSKSTVGLVKFAIQAGLE